MKEEKYKGYSLEELLEDEDFVNQIISIQTNQEWENFLQANHSAKYNIVQARKIIQLFNVSEGKLRDETKFNLWENVNEFNKNFSRRRKVIKLNVFIRYAASILIIMAIGSAIYWRYSTSNNHYSFTKIESAQNNNPILVLANKKKIELTSDKESNIIVLKNQDALLVNNDSLVQNTPQINTEQIVFNEISVPYGKKVTLQLSDGTKVDLNAGSRFAFPQSFKGKNREVYLKGEGFFEVYQNAKVPFIVKTDNIDIKVLGTKFNVSAYEDDHTVSTVLVEGKVNVSQKSKMFANSQFTLAPGQGCFYSVSEQSSVVKEVDVLDYILWKDGLYNFKKLPLSDVVNRLHKYYNISIHIEGEKLSGTLVSGKLVLSDDITEVMQYISKTIEGQSEKSADGTYILKQ